MKDIIVLGGPNGAGKTTAARELLPHRLGIREFVNADEIARGLSPFNASRASARASPSKPPAPDEVTPSSWSDAAPTDGG